MISETPFDAGPHLSTEQMGELLDERTAASAEQSVARAHLHACSLCAAEVRGLREALSLFRKTTVAYADERLAHVHRPVFTPIRERATISLPLLWTAAGVMLFASLLPMELHRPGTPHVQPRPTSPLPKVESDEALMDDVNRELSAGLPASMQPLANPTSTDFSSSDGKNSTTRKN